MDLPLPSQELSWKRGGVLGTQGRDLPSRTRSGPTSERAVDENVREARRSIHYLRTLVHGVHGYRSEGSSGMGTAMLDLNHSSCW